uniref:Phosphoprotein n=4 Tax=avian paramyxovirus 2 TaxID=2560313 RepID=A0A193KUQ3_9MONO|nr:phosphoprotein [Avian metaavulavirus 2]
MEFTDDAEIAELLDLGTSVIQELQRAELKGPQTTGKPKVPSGNTRNLATLWEKESTSQAEPGADHGNQQGDTGIPAEGMSQGTPTTETTTDQHEDAPDPKRDIEADSTNSRPGDDLDKALAKLETRAKQNRAAQPTVKKGKGANKSPLSTLPVDVPETVTLRTEEPRQPAGPVPIAGNQGTDESTPLPAEMADWKLSAGVTPFALQSERSPGGSPASVGSALSPASYAANPNDAMSALTRKVSDMESKLGEALKLLGMLPVIKNEISQLKATVALMSNQLASSISSRPGNAGVKSLNEMKSLSKPASIVIAGPGSLPPEVLDSNVIYKDELARPVTAQAYKEIKPREETSATSSELTAVQALIDTLVEDERKKSRLHQALERARTKEDILRIKRQIYNA